jgi:anti-anti-sigma regulatory factor
MSIRITQIEAEPRENFITLKVEGGLYFADAEFLEETCRAVSSRTKLPVILELADLTFLDSDSASILCRIKREQNVSFAGLQLFIKKVVETAE